MLDITKRTESRYEVIEKIVDLGESTDGLFFQVVWEGLPDKRDGTSQPAKEPFKDVSALVTAFFASCPK